MVSAPAWDGTGCELDSWQCRIYIPCSPSLRLLGYLRGSLGTLWLDTKIVLNKFQCADVCEIIKYISTLIRSGSEYRPNIFKHLNVCFYSLFRNNFTDLLFLNVKKNIVIMNIVVD